MQPWVSASETRAAVLPALSVARISLR